jgi:hypothetical protein
MFILFYVSSFLSFCLYILYETLDLSFKFKPTAGRAISFSSRKALQLHIHAAGNENVFVDIYCHVFQWLRHGFGLVNRFIGSSLVVTTFSSYTLKITVTISHVTSHTKSSNASSGHTAVPLELRNSSQFLSLSLMLRPTVSRPVCLGIEHPSGAYDQIFSTVWQLRSCFFCGAPSLTRGRVCLLSESLPTLVSHLL